MRLDLDRVALEDVGGNPEKVAEAIDAQLGRRPGAVPVHWIALSVDIQDIRKESLTNLEAALVTTAEKSEGQILVNATSSWQRQRFSVGHELFHFLSPYHKPTAQGFRCTREDMIVADSDTVHRRQESEANRFAIELLAPKRLVAPYLSSRPDLGRVIELAKALEISKEAATRRYVLLHDACVAVIYSKDGVFRYCSRDGSFPAISLKVGDRMPDLPRRANGELSEIEEDWATDWLASRNGYSLTVQTFYQSNGFEITLLTAEASEEDDGLLDTVGGFGDR